MVRMYSFIIEVAEETPMELKEQPDFQGGLTVDMVRAQ